MLDSGDVHAVQCLLDALYKHWADLSEKELARGKTTLPCWGSRGKMPQQHWVNILDQDREAPPPTAPIVFYQMAC
eukprot:8216996-Pyramimonas_sp.AAC.1